MAAIPRPVALTLLIAALLIPTWAGAQTVTNARIVEFDPSPDHTATLDDGRAAVQRYVLEVYQAGASAPFHSVDMGKPSPGVDGRIRFDFSAGVSAWPAPGGEYEARVAAVGPGGEGLSDASNRFTVSQCAFTLSGSSALFPAAGGGGSVGVATTAGCTWTLAEGLSWVTPMNASGSGPGTATYSVAANTGTSQRSGTLTIAGRPYQVTQEGSCSYSLSPSSASFAASGGTGSVSVTTTSGCAWSASSGVSWISIGTASGSGTATARYTVAANTSTSSRSGTVTIAGRAHTVSQAAASGGGTAPDPATSALPSPWQTRDIGSVGLAGSAVYSSGLFTVRGAGADIWGSADAFRFVYRPQLSGGEIVARVTYETNTHALAKAGVMLRDGTGANARHVALVVKPGGGIEFLRRASASGSTTYLGGATQAFPAWVRLRRSGTTVTAAVSANGSTWRTVGSTSLSTSTPLMGLAVTSHTTSKLNLSKFDHVSVR